MLDKTREKRSRSDGSECKTKKSIGFFLEQSKMSKNLIYFISLFMFFILTISYKIKKTIKKIEKIKEYMLKKYVTLSNIENAWGDMILGMYNHVKTDNCYEDIYIISYIGFRQVIRQLDLETQVSRTREL